VKLHMQRCYQRLFKLLCGGGGGGQKIFLNQKGGGAKVGL
jgi:hypothetical protein